MRSTTTKLATAIAAAIALAVYALPQAAVAQAAFGPRADNPPGSAFQDQGMWEEQGDHPVAADHRSFAQANGRTVQRTPTYGASEIGTLPGYSARPEGMCWERPG